MPILLIGFNRPELFISNLEHILSLTSGPVFIALDGPRKNNELDAEKCKKLRHYVMSMSHDSRIHYKINDTNHGCKLGVESALDWFFANIDHGLIIEDDCLISKHALQFAKAGLKILKKRQDVFALNMTNFGDGLTGQNFHPLTKYIHVWGWVTTSENWVRYRKTELTIDKDALSEWSFDRLEYRSWLTKLKKVKANKIDTWDYNVQCHLINNKLLCIVPKYNLVENIGFDENATHTTQQPNYVPKIDQVAEPQQLPDITESYDSRVDRLIYQSRLKPKSLVSRIIQKLGWSLK